MRNMAYGAVSLHDPVVAYAVTGSPASKAAYSPGRTTASGKAVARPLSKSTSRSRSPPSSTWILVCAAGGALDTMGSRVSDPHAPGDVGHALADRPSGSVLIRSDGAGLGTARSRGRSVEARRTIRVSSATRTRIHPAHRRPRLEA